MQEIPCDLKEAQAVIVAVHRGFLRLRRDWVADGLPVAIELDSLLSCLYVDLNSSVHPVSWRNLYAYLLS